MKNSRLHWEHDDTYFTSQTSEYERIFEYPATVVPEEVAPAEVLGRIPRKLNGTMSSFIEPLRNAIVRNDAMRTQTKVIGLTSARNGEGVSTISAGLAVTLSGHREGRVLFADCNFYRPSVHRQFNLQLTPGFSDMIRDNLPISSVINSVDPKYLDVLTAGTVFPAEQGLTTCLRLRSMFEQFLEDYQYVVLDLPSLERSHQCCMAFSEFVNGIILVIECERTRTEALNHVIDNFSRSKVNLMGVVLNKRKFYLPDWLYNKL